MTIMPTGPVPPYRNPEVVLHGAISRYTAAGYRVESMTPRSAVMIIGKPCNHILHLLLTLATCGLWAPVWILVAASVRVHRVTVTVTDQGQVFYAEGSGSL